MQLGHDISTFPSLLQSNFPHVLQRLSFTTNIILFNLNFQWVNSINLKNIIVIINVNINTSTTRNIEIYITISNEILLRN